MKLIRKTYETRREKAIDFSLGFAGWFIVNGVLWAVISFGLGPLDALLSRLFGSSSDAYQTAITVVTLTITCLPLLLNVAALIFFGFIRHWIALGALGAFAAVLLIALCAGVVFLVMCFSGNTNF